MVSIIGELKQSVIARIKPACTNIAAGSDLKKESIRATPDIKVICDKPDKFYCDVVTSR